MADLELVARWRLLDCPEINSRGILCQEVDANPEPADRRGSKIEPRLSENCALELGSKLRRRRA